MKKNLKTIHYCLTPLGVNQCAQIQTTFCTNKLVQNIFELCIMALTINKILKYNIYDDKINADIFFNFIKLIIDDINIKGYTFIFDNASFHKKKEILNLIINSGNSYLFTPPYSPNNNPIENMFGIIKTEYTKQIINDIINKNILSTKEKKRIQLENKNKIIIKNKLELKNNKNEIKNELIKTIFNKKVENKKLKNNNLKIELKEILTIKRDKIKELNLINKNKIKKEIKGNNMQNIIKFYLHKTIEIIKIKYERISIEKIFNHSLNYDYTNIEK